MLIADWHVNWSFGFTVHFLPTLRINVSIEMIRAVRFIDQGKISALRKHGILECIDGQVIGVKIGINSMDCVGRCPCWD